MNTYSLHKLLFKGFQFPVVINLTKADKFAINIQLGCLDLIFRFEYQSIPDL